MALIKPFAALRPQPPLAAKICELPYDVMSSEEARQMAAGNPLSFLHVSKPEIDLPAGIDVHDAQVYVKGRENFDRLTAQGALRQDASPAFYLYRQIMGAHTQTGLVAAASCEDYLRGIVKKHELTRPDKEDDRVRHIETLNSQTGPVFLVYRAVKQMDELVAKQTAQTPDTDFTAADGIRHSAWALRDTAQIEFIRATFAKIPALYIADGHHRCAAAARVFQARHGAGESAFFLSVIFPDNQVKILPYNRVLKDLNGLTPAQLLEKLKTVFVVSDKSGVGDPEKEISHEILESAVKEALLSAAKNEVGLMRGLRCVANVKSGEIKVFAKLIVCETVTSKLEQISILEARHTKPDAVLGDEVELEVTPNGFSRVASKYARQALMDQVRRAEGELAKGPGTVVDDHHSQPGAKHELGLYLEGRWHGLRFRSQACSGKNTSESLDVTLLQKLVLAPIFGIDDPRTSQRVNFVGGIRGPAELEKLVNTKEYACAFSMFPTGIADLMSIADAGGIMPPKSTWFEPKLRDAMFCHNL